MAQGNGSATQYPKGHRAAILLIKLILIAVSALISWILPWLFVGLPGGEKPASVAVKAVLVFAAVFCAFVAGMLRLPPPPASVAAPSSEPSSAD
jgi:hypothetical protein